MIPEQRMFIFIVIITISFNYDLESPPAAIILISSSPTTKPSHHDPTYWIDLEAKWNITIKCHNCYREKKKWKRKKKPTKGAGALSLVSVYNSDRSVGEAEYYCKVFSYCRAR